MVRNGITRISTRLVVAILVGMLATLCPGRPLIAQTDSGTASYSIKFILSLGETDRAHTGVIKNVLLLNQDQQALTCGADGTVCLWDLASGEIIRRFADPDFKTVYCLALSKDESTFLCAGDGNGICHWEIETGRLIKKFEHGNRIYSMALLDDEKSFLFGDSTGGLVHQSLESDDPIYEWPKGSEGYTALQLTPDQSQFVTGDGDGNIELWNWDKKHPVDKFEGLGHWVCCIRISEDGSQLLGTDYNGNVYLWNTTDQKTVWNKQKLSSQICWAQFLNDETIVAVDRKNHLFQLDRKTGESKRSRIQIPAVAGFTLSKNETQIWCGGQNHLTGWDIKSGDQVFPAESERKTLRSKNNLEVVNQIAYWTENETTLVALELENDRELFRIDLRKQYQVPGNTAKSAEVEEGDLSLHPMEAGLLVHGTSRYVVLDYRTGELVSSCNTLRSHKIARLNDRELAFINLDQVSIARFDTTTKEQTTFAKAKNDRLQNLNRIDDDMILVGMSTHPDEFGIWSHGSESYLQQARFEDGFSLLATGKHHLVGLDNQSQLVVVAAPQKATQTIGQERVTRLVEKLSDDLYSVRRNATNELITGGRDVIPILRQLNPRSAETRARILKIQIAIAESGVPKLDQRLTLDRDAYESFTDKKPQCAAADADGKYFLVAMRDNWRSELLLCVSDDKKIEVATRIKLRSSATAIQQDLERKDTFVIAYKNGQQDVIQIQKAE